MINGYSICFNEWAMDKSIKSELGLLLIISGLTAEKGYCYASNEYFAKLFKIEERTVSRRIAKLNKKGYVKLDYKKSGAFVISREIRLTKMSTKLDKSVLGKVDKSVLGKVDKSVLENSTSINTTKDNKENLAFSFLKTNCPSRLETEFVMRYNKSISNKKKFVQDFNDTVQIEIDNNKLNWTANSLFARLSKYARNYAQNESKYSEPEEEKRVYLKKVR
jgi:DNA-binding transcriptional regulator YhcF (GntR family)